MNLYDNWSESLGPILQEAALNAVLWAVIFALLGVILAIITMVSIHRRRLLHRTKWIWNLFAKFSYLLIMLSFLMTGVFIGALYGVQRTLDHALVVTMKPALEAQMPAMRELLTDYLTPMPSERMLTARDLVDPIVKARVYMPKNEGLLEAVKAKFANQVFYKIAAYALTQAFQQSMKKLTGFLQINDTGAEETLIEFSTESMLKVLSESGEHVDFTTLDKTVPEIFVASMQKQLNGLFHNFYIGLVIKLLIAALVIGAEMLVYFKYYLPRKQPVEPDLA